MRIREGAHSIYPQAADNKQFGKRDDKKERNKHTIIDKGFAFLPFLLPKHVAIFIPHASRQRAESAQTLCDKTAQRQKKIREHI